MTRENIEHIVVEELAARSRTEYHELIAEMIDYYGVQGVRDMIAEQFIEYAALKNIEIKDGDE